MAVDAAYVYWGGGGAIGRANLDGTGVDQAFITGASAGGGAGVAVDAAHVYWTNGLGDTIGRANLDGTGVEQSFVTGARFPAGVAADAAHVYWAHAPAAYTGAIGRANLDGTGVDQSFITFDLITGVPFTRGLAVDAAHVYWASGGNGAIGRANLDGTGVDPSFITGALDPAGVAVNFNLGRLKMDNKNGTAKLTVQVPAPGGIALAQTTNVKGAEVRADAAGEVQLAIVPRGKAKRKLAHKGKAKVKVEVTYTPDGGQPSTQTRAVKLKR